MQELPKKNPFKTPEDYFEGFSDGLLDRLNSEKSIPQQEGFTVPDGYFDGLEKNITDKLQHQRSKVIALPGKKYYWAAASVAAIAMLVYGLNTKAEEPSWNDLANTDIENYFESNHIELTTYELAEMMAVDELEINDIISTTFDEEKVINYLDENTDDFEELNLEDYE